MEKAELEKKIKFFLSIHLAPNMQHRLDDIAKIEADKTDEKAKVYVVPRRYAKEKNVSYTLH